MKTLRVTWTKTMLVTADDEEAAHVLDPYDSTDVYEAADRWLRIAAHGIQHIEGDVTVEEHTDDSVWPCEIQPIHSNDPEKYLWSARHFVGKAMYELSRGRYRQGRCPELDEVNGGLARLEDRLRLMALEIDRPDLPEVVAWRKQVSA